MFPTLSHLTEYLFGFKFRFPIQTFGFFEMLSFVSAYLIFSSEFKRKEKLGLIHSWTRESRLTQFSFVLELFVNGLLGFITGFKILGFIFDYQVYVSKPLNFLFSLNGSILGGILVGLAIILFHYFKKRAVFSSAPKVVKEIVHPYQLMPSLTLAAAFWGFLGAKLFSVLENFDAFFQDPLSLILSSAGWSFYGGLIFGSIAYFFIGMRHGMKMIHLADIGSPGMLVSYGVGRIGCHLAGDGDWGIVNSNPRPQWLTNLPDWAWSFKFPHNVINEGIPLDNCVGKYCSVLLHGVYPTSLYEAIMILSVFTLLWVLRKKMAVPGQMFFLYLILNGAERFLIEKIRINPTYDILGTAFTQAQMISLVMILAGAGGLVWTCRKKMTRNFEDNLNRSVAR